MTSCASVEACYRQSGFGLKDEFHDLPDHICAELDHAAILIAGDRESEVAAFRSEHLQGLLEGFSATLLRESENEVLRSIAEAIRALAAEEDWCCADAASKELQR